jgi:hypothetical protein
MFSGIGAGFMPLVVMKPAISMGSSIMISGS